MFLVYIFCFLYCHVWVWHDWVWAWIYWWVEDMASDLYVPCWIEDKAKMAAEIPGSLPVEAIRSDGLNKQRSRYLSKSALSK